MSITPEPGRNHANVRLNVNFARIFHSDTGWVSPCLMMARYSNVIITDGARHPSLIIA